MKKYLKIIIPIIVVLIAVVIGIVWNMNKNKLEPGFASIESNNWPNIINNDEEISEISKAFIYAVYGEDNKVNIESLEVQHPEEDKIYVQLNYSEDIYTADKLDNTLYVFKSDLIDGTIDANIDYNNESTHIEQPNEVVLKKANKVINTLEKVYTDYDFVINEASVYPTEISENISNLYVRRDDGFAQFSLGYYSKDKTKTMNLVIILQNENIIGIAIQINE